MQTVHAHLEVEIDRRPEEVWAVVGDYASDPRWRGGVKAMIADPDGPPAPGTRVHEVLEMAGRTYTTDSVVTEAGPGLRYRFAGEGTGGAVRGGRAVQPGPRPGSSRFTYDVEVEPTGVPFGLRRIMGWWMRRSFRRDLARLRDLLEAS